VRRNTLCWAIAAVLTLATSANAQFQTMDRQQSKTGAEVQFSFVGLDDPTIGDVTLMRTDLYGEVDVKGVGLYASLPVTRSIDVPGEETTAVGNLEMGGVHQMDLSGPVDLVSHIGVTAPTAGDSLTDVTINTFGSFARVGDLFFGSDPNLVSLRGATSPRWQSGPVFLRADVGIDVAIPTDDRDTEAAFRGNIGAGVDVMLLTLTTEISNVGIMTENGSASENFLHTLSLGATLNTPIAKPQLAYTTPLDDGLRGEIWVVSAGLALGF